MVLGEVEGCPATQCLQLDGIASANAPNILDGTPLQGFLTLVVVVYHAAMVIDLILLRQLRGNLRQRLGGCQTDADGHSYFALYAFVKMLAPLLQLVECYAVQIQKALVDGVAEIRGSLLSDDAHYPTRQFAIQLVVRREHGNLLIRELLSQLKVRRTFFHTQGLRLVAPCHHTAVVVRQHDDRLTLQVWSEDALAGNVAVIEVGNSVH